MGTTAFKTQCLIPEPRSRILEADLRPVPEEVVEVSPGGQALALRPDLRHAPGD